MYLLTDRVENTLTLKLERAQLTAERLEHRLHMLQTNVQVVFYRLQKWFFVYKCGNNNENKTILMISGNNQREQ